MKYYSRWPDWLYLNSFFSFEDFDSFDQYAAFWFPLTFTMKDWEKTVNYPSLCDIDFVITCVQSCESFLMWDSLTRTVLAKCQPYCQVTQSLSITLNKMPAYSYI